jgi:hypothetical protein
METRNRGCNYDIVPLLFAVQVRPLRRQLGTLKAWITGQRKDQSPGTRMAVPVVEVDPVFEGVAGGPGSLIKYNPLSNMSSAEVWNFLRVMGVPTNKLHECGYISIGCEPCTRPVLPNQHEREGRWWWEDATGEAAVTCYVLLHHGNCMLLGASILVRAGVTGLLALLVLYSHAASLSTMFCRTICYRHSLINTQCKQPRSAGCTLAT